MKTKREKLGINELVDKISNRDSQSKYNSLATWSHTDWCCGLAGEVGELCNMVKKIRRGSKTMKQLKKEIAKELADVILYTCLTSKSMGIDLEASIIQKFNEVSKRLNSKQRL
jgi:NTP pyrophosphatase (non-canonical NTP hydrolase)